MHSVRVFLSVWPVCELCKWVYCWYAELVESQSTCLDELEQDVMTYLDSSHDVHKSPDGKSEMRQILKTCN